jgi:hypothetical protein
MFILQEEYAKRGYTPTYLFLLVIIRLTCSLFCEAFIVLNVKISSASLVYAHYMFRPAYS